MTLKTRRLSLSLMLAVTLILPACGGNSGSATPQANTGNIPNLATRPSPQASALKKVRLAGSVFNAVSGEGIDQAEVLVQLPVAAVSPAVTPPPANNSVATPNPGSTPTPAATVAPTPLPTPPGPAGNNPVPNLPPSAPPGAPGGLPPVPDLNASPSSNASLPLGDSPFLAAVGQAFMLAQATTSSPSPNSGPERFSTHSNNRGKFFVNDVPEGQYTVTISAKGYRTLTLTNVSPNQLEIPLTPLDNEKQVDVVGMVLSPAERPVEDAVVSPSFPLGEAIGIPATTNSLGEFKLPAVPFGTHTLVALIQEPNQQIKQMGLLTNIPISNKTLKVKSLALPSAGPSASGSPATSPEKRKELEEAVKNILKEEPEASESGKVTDPEASASPESNPENPANTEQPESEASVKPSATPSEEASPAPEPSGETLSENEEETPKEGFNLLKAATELITGQKSDEVDSEQEIYPVIALRSVLSEMVLAGEVTLPEGYTLKSMEVYLTLPADTDVHPEEVFLLSQAFRKPTPKAPKPGTSPSPAASASPGTPEPERFRVVLPDLEKEQRYHLQFTAAHESGGLTYHHLYNLNQPDEKLSVSFVPASEKIEIEGEDVNAVPPVPGFGWAPVNGAELYHVTLEGGSGANRRIVWEAWTRETQIQYPLTSKEGRLKEQQTYTVAVSAVKGLSPAFNGKRKQTAHPAYQMIWTDLSRVTHTPFEVVE